MTRQASLEEAIGIAAAAHAGQKDKAGAPYILHPLRVMLRLPSEAERIAAVLHDVVEDTDWTIARLRERGFSEEVLAAVDCLTHREGESYDAFIERIQPNPLARRVKLADLEDNMDMRRIAAPTERDRERLAKYRHAWDVLNRASATPAPGEPCACHDDAHRSLTTFVSLGMDARFGEVSTATCARCGQTWLRYFYENEAFTASQRFYLGAITGEQAARLTVDNARLILESLDWYFYGGSFFHGATGKRKGELNLYP